MMIYELVRFASGLDEKSPALGENALAQLY